MVGSKIEQMAKEAIADQMRSYRRGASSKGLAALNAKVIDVSPHLDRPVDQSERNVRPGAGRVAAPRPSTPAASQGNNHNFSRWIEDEQVTAGQHHLHPADRRQTAAPQAHWQAEMVKNLANINELVRQATMYEAQSR